MEGNTLLSAIPFLPYCPAPEDEGRAEQRSLDLPSLCGSVVEFCLMNQEVMV